MATNVTEMQVVGSPETTQLPQPTQVRNSPCPHVSYVLNLFSQTPQLGQPIHIIPGLGNLDSSDHGCHDTSAQNSDVPHASSATCEPVSSLLDAVQHAPMNIDGLPVHNALDNSDTLQQSQNSQNLEMATEAANNEWRRQHVNFHDDKKIHHFNFLGDGVACKNATPPAVSLLVAVSGAKAGFIDREGFVDIHGYAVMRSAMKLVDPVIYYGQPEILNLRGEQLRDAATGLCEKSYSEHGTWRSQDYDEEDDLPSLDRMHVLGYPKYSIPVNGWLKSPLVFNRWGLEEMSCRMAKHNEKQLRERLQQQHACERKGSLLHHVTTMEDLDPLPKDESDKVEATTPPKNHNGAKKFESWTVDLSKFLGKCKNWADEIEDEDDNPAGYNAAVPASQSSHEGTQSSAAEEAEDNTDVEAAPTSATTSGADARPVPDVRPADDESSSGEDSETNELTSTESAVQPPVVPDSVAPNSLVQELSDKGMTDEEVEAEDNEFYDDPPLVSEDISLLLDRLRESGLIAGDNAAHSPQSSEEENSGETATPTLVSEPIPFGGSVNLPIREKSKSPAGVQQNGPAPASSRNPSVESSSTSSLLIREKPDAPANGSQTVSVTALEEASLATPSSSFTLPIRSKVPGSFGLSKSNGGSLSAAKVNQTQMIVPAFAQGTTQVSPVRPSTSPLEEALADVKDEAGTDANEKRSPIASETLDCVVLPLRPRKLHGCRLTDSPFALSETSSKAWQAAGLSDNVGQSPSKHTAESASTSLLPNEVVRSAIVSPGQMLEKFKNAPSTPSKKSSGIPRSSFFPDLKALVIKKAPRSSSQRQPSVPSCSQVDKLDAISEADEAESGKKERSPKKAQETLITTSDVVVSLSNVNLSEEDLTDYTGSDERLGEAGIVTIPQLPIRSPYRRPVSNTPRKMMGRSIQFDLPSDADSDSSNAGEDSQNRIDDGNVTVEDTGAHASYAFKNWSRAMAHDDCIDNPQPIPALVDRVSVLASPPTTGGSTATESEAISGPSSAGESSDDTGATTPPQTPKSVRDVKFVRTRPSKPTWDKIKETLTVTSSTPKIPAPKTKKSRFGKAVKHFLRKGIEAFAVSS